MVERQGKFVGGYVPDDVKAGLIRLARSRHKNVTQILIEILSAAVGPEGETDASIGQRNGADTHGICDSDVDANRTNFES